MRPPNSKLIGVAVLLVGLAALSSALFDWTFRLLGLSVGAPLVILSFSLLGRTGRFAESLQPLAGRSMRLAIWGAPPPGPGDSVFRIESITLLGFGLWIHARREGGGTLSKLKIAQPTTLSFDGARAEIGFAGYVQWDGRRIPGPDGRRAPGAVSLSPV